MTYASNGYIRNPHTACYQNGCRYGDAVQCLAAAQQLLDESKERKPGMPAAVSLFCERGNHSFSSKEGYVIVDRREFDGSGAVVDSDDVTMCKNHAREAGLMPLESFPAIENDKEG